MSEPSFDTWVAKARAVPLQDVLRRHSDIKLSGRGGNLVGPCPKCGGTDRFAVSLRKRQFNCRGCGGKGTGAIDLETFLDSGADFQEIVTRLTGKPSPEKKKNGKARDEGAPALVGEFIYEDENGEPLFRVQRFDRRNPDGSPLIGKDGKTEKFFVQSRPDPNLSGRWLKGIEGVRRVLYRLPELLEDLAHDCEIIIVEGERKVDLLRDQWNVPATCSPMGAKNWRDEYAAPLPGAKIIALPDNDALGRVYLNTLAASLIKVGATVRVLGLPGLGPKGYIINWAAAGGTREKLDELIASEARSWVQSNSGDAEAPLEFEIITRRASEITPEVIKWLWKSWLAKGKLHIIAGVPEAGKTTIALSYAAIVSSGGTWPDGTHAEVGNVLIWTSEDDAADTIIPRLIRMGADLNRIHIIEQTRAPGAKSRPFNPATDMAALAEKAKAIGNVALLILDPVALAVPITRNSHNQVETRAGLQPVVDFTQEIKCASVGIAHLTKGTAGKDPLKRVNGSGAFGQLPRLVMFAANNAAEGEDQPERIMVRVKSNISKSGGGFGYHIDAAPLNEHPDIRATRIVWELPLEGTARELLAEAEGQDAVAKVTKLEQAKKFLKTALDSGERRQTDIQAEAEALGICEKTLRRAAKEGVAKRKEGQGGPWLWRSKT